MKKNIKVDYKKHIGNDGTIYDQTITLKKDFIKYINKNIKYYFNSSEDVKNITAETIGFSTYYDCYLEELNIKEKINYLTLTQLSFIYYYLNINNYNIKRILKRNTIVKMVE